MMWMTPSPTSVVFWQISQLKQQGVPTMASNPRLIPLNAQQWRILQLQDWSLVDVSPDKWSSLPGGIPGSDTVGVMGSGDLTQTQVLNGQNAVGGIDWIRHETNPKKNEPDLNVYHFIILKQSNGDIFLRGPYTSETWAPHWSKLEDLVAYQRLEINLEGSPEE
jgi:hypothetical protein